jgi:hypothetical protein
MQARALDLGALFWVRKNPFSFILFTADVIFTERANSTAPPKAGPSRLPCLDPVTRVATGASARRRRKRGCRANHPGRRCVRRCPVRSRRRPARAVRPSPIELWSYRRPVELRSPSWNSWLALGPGAVLRPRRALAATVRQTPPDLQRVFAPFGAGGVSPRRAAVASAHARPGLTPPRRGSWNSLRSSRWAASLYALHLVTTRCWRPPLPRGPPTRCRARKWKSCAALSSGQGPALDTSACVWRRAKGRLGPQ